jgi:cold shock CspA family protein
MADERKFGRVKHWNANSAYGFIVEDGGPQHFFRIRDIVTPGVDDVPVGQRVQFGIGVNGKPQAVSPPALPGFSGTTDLSATPGRPACPSRASGWSSLTTPQGSSWARGSWMTSERLPRWRSCGRTETEMRVRQSLNYSRRRIMESIEHIFVDGHLVGHIAQDIGFEAFNHHGSYVGTFPTKQQARKALEREPALCVDC